MEEEDETGHFTDEDNYNSDDDMRDEQQYRVKHFEADGAKLLHLKEGVRTLNPCDQFHKHVLHRSKVFCALRHTFEKLFYA